jgi:uncharacterized protein (DUF1501 family)
MQNRRQFMQSVAGVYGGCLALGISAPRWWRQAAAAAEGSTSGRKLVVIELQGGNDGLNTVIPFADDAYYQARPALGIPAGEVLKLDDHLGLHPAMKSWQPLWEAGQLAVVENCGYPNPNRSHFESMDIWHAGQPDVRVTSGWLGRAADNAAAGELCYVGQGAASRALSRRQHLVASLERLSDLQLRSDASQLSVVPRGRRSELVDLVASRQQQARELSTRMAKEAADEVPAAAANNRPLVDRLGLVRQLIEQEQPFRVYYTALDGFDTHGQQAGAHRNLLAQVSDAVSGFLKELNDKKLGDDVAVFLFSEFGRRVKENSSLGTDHGAAAPVFVAGNRVKGGLQGGVPNLNDLDDGDIRHQIDFRDVYAGLLTDWLGVDASAVLGQREKPVRMFS